MARCAAPSCRRRRARDKLNGVPSHWARLRIDVVRLAGKVKRHYTGTVSICMGGHLSGNLAVPLDMLCGGRRHVA